MTRFPRFRSVRAQFAFWLVLAAVVPLMVAGYIIYVQRARVIKADAFSTLEAIRDLRVGEVNDWLDGVLADLKAIAADSDIQRFEVMHERQVRTPEDERVLESIRELFRSWARDHTAYTEWLLISVPSGTVEASNVAAREGESRVADPYFTEPLRTGETFIKDIYYSTFERRNSMAFSCPVLCREHDGEHVSGVVVVSVDLERSIYSLLSERTGLGRTGETLIVNGDCIALSELRWHENAPLELKIRAQPASQAAAGLTGIAETPDYRGEMVLAAYTHIPRTNWGFVAKQDFDEVYASVHALTWQVAGVLAAAAAAAVVFAVFLGTNIARPVLRLRDAADRIQAGDLTVRAAVERRDELGFLAESFNKMADSMGASLLISRGVAEVADAAVGANDLAQFGHTLLQKLLEVTDAHVGAFYVRSRDGSDRLEPLASVGLDASALKPFAAESFEGELGPALAGEGVAHLKHIPGDTVFTFRTLAGTAIPREIVTVPLMVRDEVAAAISLGTLNGYSDESLAIIRQSRVTLNSAVSHLVVSDARARLAQEVQRTNETLATLNEELRTTSDELRGQAAQLESTNRELEAFSYSVSHDLRAPLRAMNGFSEALLEDYEDRLDEKGRGYLRRVRDGSVRMGRLIDGLLDLSRITRWRMQREEVDLSGLARGIAADLLESGPERTVQFVICDDARASADAELIRVALQNMLDNAWKFTQPRPNARIEFGTTEVDGGPAFFVRDNGVGFDMAYADKLFGAFQRLHSTAEFGGTGIGLATVQRIIQRHGGRIWAEAEVDRGATFHFTLQ